MHTVESRYKCRVIEGCGYVCCGSDAVRQWWALGRAHIPTCCHVRIPFREVLQALAILRCYREQDQRLDTIDQKAVSGVNMVRLPQRAVSQRRAPPSPMPGPRRFLLSPSLSPPYGMVNRLHCWYGATNSGCSNTTLRTAPAQFGSTCEGRETSNQLAFGAHWSVQSFSTGPLNTDLNVIMSTRALSASDVLVIDVGFFLPCRTTTMLPRCPIAPLSVRHSLTTTDVDCGDHMTV